MTAGAPGEFCGHTAYDPACVDCLTEGAPPTVAVPPERATSRPFGAKYTSGCPHCSRRIGLGDSAVYTNRERVVHEGCVPPKE